MNTTDNNLDKPVLHIYMRDYGAFLSTRQAGKKAADEFRRLTRAEGDVILDFDGVEAATPPFLQEVLDAVTALTIANEDTGRIVLAAHLNDDLTETLRYVAHHAKRSVAYVHGGKLDLFRERPQLAKTLQEAQRLRPFFTAPELAKGLNIKAPAATKRLRALVALGAAERQLDPTARQGKRHQYRVANPELANPEIEKARRGAQKRISA